MKRVLLAMTSILFVCGIAFACDSGWQYVAEAPWEWYAAVENPDDPTSFLIGTWRNWPDSPGGVYRHDEPDSTWIYAGLINQDIWQLSNFSYCRPNCIFAATSERLYVYNEDTTWTEIYGITYHDYRVAELAISPHDTSTWVLSIGAIFLNPQIRLSRDSGQNWHLFKTGYSTNHIIFSRVYPDVFYYREVRALICANLADSTFENAGVFGDWDFLDLTYHTTQPWIYVSGITTPGEYRLGRYDELTHDTIRVSLPDEYAHFSNITYIDSVGLIAGTSGGLVYVSDDLTYWQPLNDTLAQYIYRILSVGSQRCIGGTWDHVYTAEHSLPANDPFIPHPSSLILYPNFPNPFNTSTEIRFDLPHAAHVTLGVYDITGRHVAALADQDFVAGSHHVTFQANDLPSGIYISRIMTGEQAKAQKMILLK